MRYLGDRQYISLNILFQLCLDWTQRWSSSLTPPNLGYWSEPSLNSQHLFHNVCYWTAMWQARCWSILVTKLDLWQVLLHEACDEDGLLLLKNHKKLNIQQNDLVCKYKLVKKFKAYFLFKYLGAYLNQTDDICLG